MAKNHLFEYEVLAVHTDCSGRLSPQHLGAILLNSASCSADVSGFGVNDLNPRGWTWVVSKISIRLFQRRPRLGEKFTVETWIELCSNAFQTRNFRLRDAQGNLLAESSSDWSVIDINTRRLVNLNQEELFLRAATGETIPLGHSMRLNNPAESKLVATHPVVYTDLDFNSHVNSMKYLEWILNLYTPQHFVEHAFAGADVNYLREVLFGNDVQIFQSEQEDGALFYLNDSNGRTISRIRLHWK